MTQVIADHREQKSGVVKELAKKKINVKVETLVIADYVVQSKDLNGNIVNIGIERKTQNDLLNSIIDRRLIQQMIEIKKHFTCPLLIIEGEENIYKMRNFHPNSIRGMLSTIAIDFQVPIIHTRNHRDTASYIEVLAKRLEKERSAISLLQKRKPQTMKEKQEYLIQSLPGIGPSIAKNLLEKFSTPEKVFTASEKELEEVDKIGKKKAAEIRDVLDVLYDEDKKE
jgi:ERCC4-type nuclease